MNSVVLEIGRNVKVLYLLSDNNVISVRNLISKIHLIKHLFTNKYRILKHDAGRKKITEF